MTSFMSCSSLSKLSLSFTHIVPILAVKENAAKIICVSSHFFPFFQRIRITFVICHMSFIEAVVNTHRLKQYIHRLYHPLHVRWSYCRYIWVTKSCTDRWLHKGCLLRYMSTKKEETNTEEEEGVHRAVRRDGSCTNGPTPLECRKNSVADVKEEGIFLWWVGFLLLIITLSLWYLNTMRNVVKLIFHFSNLNPARGVLWGKQ